MRRRADRSDEEPGTLEIEFEDDEASSGPAASPAGRPRDLRSAALIVLTATVLGAAVYGVHHGVGSSGTGPSGVDGTAPAVVITGPNYAAFVVTVGYQGSHLLSLPQRRLEVDLRITPVTGAQVSILDYYVSENGVTSRAVSAHSMTPLPPAGTDVRLELTVTDCATVPIGESMSFVDVVANGPIGVMDRFTILGDRYSDDLARLLREVCPERASGQNPLTSAGRVTGP